VSTGLDCYFHEVKPNEWYLFLEEEYGSKLDPEYDKFGPFKTFRLAYVYLNDNFANPGGFSVQQHPDSTDKTYDDLCDGSDDGEAW
jgi:hypothetical protein